RVDDFINFINMLGYHVTGKININHSKSMQQILDQLRDKPEFPILTTLMLRTMQKAVYDPENIGHYGLASKIYTHFTSPIRRFPDTTVHHLLRTYLFNKDVSIDTVEYWKNYLPVLTEHASIKEKDAVDCEREVESMKMAEYMMDHIGEEYEGMISGAASFGIFVQLPNMVEGLIKISDIPGDYFIYDERTMSVIGQKTKKMYRIGQKIKVIVKSASKEESFVDFGLVIESANDDEKAKEIKKVE
ncbi:MAG: RNB domain-containing ribonuclease, partial [Bacilli bacterium]